MDKENVAPPTSGATASAVAASRRHGYAVKSCGVKKKCPSRARLPRRVPFRDITNLFEVISAVAVPEAEAPLGFRLAGVQDGGDAAGPAAKPARYFPPKAFR